MNDTYRLMSFVSRHNRLYVVEDSSTGEWLFWHEDGVFACNIMTIANGLRAGVEN